MLYLIPDDVLAINEFVLAPEGQPSHLRDAGALESALMRPQMAAHYAGIALAHAFVDGNKRAALLAGEMFVDLNGSRVESGPLEFAKAMLALVNHGESVEGATANLESWMRARLHPQR
jgi:death-on-curing protein